MYSHATEPVWRASERGVIMVPVLAAVVLLIAIGSSALLAGRSNMKRVEVSRCAVQALAIAEAGALRALDEVRENRDLDARKGIGRVAGDFGGGVYEAETTELARSHYRVLSEGAVNGIPRRIELVVRKGPGFAFTDALRTREGAEIARVHYDSYDSDKGLYTLQALNLDFWGLHGNENARVSSNGTITADGTSVFRGDVAFGAGESFESQAATHVAGEEYELAEPVEMPAPPIEAFERAHDTNANGSWTAIGGYTYGATDKSLRLSAGTELFLQPGTYFFSSLELGLGSVLWATGETRIFVTGSFDASLGLVMNTSNVPRNLQVYAHPFDVRGIPAGVDTTIKLSSVTPGSMTIYGPEYHVERHGAVGEFFGAIACKTADVEGMRHHYDETLASFSGVIAPGREFVRVFAKSSSPPID